MTRKKTEDVEEEFQGLEDKLEDMDNTPVPAGSSEVTLTFKQNRTFELHIGRALVRFEGRESKTVPRSYLTHKDFTKQIADQFVIQEVK